MKNTCKICGIFCNYDVCDDCDYKLKKVKQEQEELEEYESMNMFNLESSYNKITAGQTQIGGTHYKDKAIQPWDYILANDLGYLEGNIIKYLTRWKDKGGLQDLKKAQHYLQKLIEIAS